MSREEEVDVEALRSETERWRLMVESAPDFILLVDADGRLHYVSRTVAGIRREEAVGRTLFDYAPREYHPAVREALRRVFDGGETAEFESVGPGPDGTKAYYQCRVAPVSRQGVVVGATLVATDITDRRRVREAMRVSTDRLVALMDSVPHYLWTKDFDVAGRITYRYYTPIVERITGRPPEYFMETPDRWITTIHEEDRAHVAAAAQRLLLRRSGREDARYRILLPDGGVRWVRDSVTAEPLKGGGVRLCGVVSEATAPEKLAEALRDCDALLASGLGEAEKAQVVRIREAVHGALTAR